MQFIILICSIMAVVLAGPLAVFKRQANTTVSSGNSTSNLMTLQYCNATGQRYVPAIYTCYPTALCKTGLSACGKACYAPTMYSCMNGTLFSISMNTTSMNTTSGTRNTTNSTIVARDTKFSRTKLF